ncbi:hypothetical protein BU16DRAFT_114902 [Lophium mytilinum]|uniref:Uncharacterized protein n=1 Tax=Lophium mytilinum TaxID=390894 RepID=A0A6A6QK47_9PEZI|nr:hypothetical protein BU16DRAFT_114902 [Lophium mytilinum]
MPHLALRGPAWISPVPTSTPPPIVLTIERSTTTYITTIYRTKESDSVASTGYIEPRISDQSPGVIAGAAIGSLLGLVAIFVVCCLCCCQGGRSQSKLARRKSLPTNKQGLRRELLSLERNRIERNDRLVIVEEGPYNGEEARLDTEERAQSGLEVSLTVTDSQEGSSFSDRTDQAIGSPPRAAGSAGRGSPFEVPTRVAWHLSFRT